jgi:hypothetical protein
MRDDDLPGEASATIETETATPNPNETPEQRAKREADDKVLRTMRGRFKTGGNGWRHFRENALLDAKFRAGTWGKKSFQWIDNIADRARRRRRPCSPSTARPASCTR